MLDETVIKLLGLQRVAIPQDILFSNEHRWEELPEKVKTHFERRILHGEEVPKEVPEVGYPDGDITWYAEGDIFKKFYWKRPNEEQWHEYEFKFLAQWIEEYEIPIPNYGLRDLPLETPDNPIEPFFKSNPNAEHFKFKEILWRYETEIQLEYRATKHYRQEILGVVNLFLNSLDALV